MALTRKSLKAMGLTEEQVDSIVEMHTEVKEDLKNQLNAANEKAEKYDAVKKELDELKAHGGDDFEEKYNTEHQAFEDFKAKIESEKAFEKKKSAFVGLAKKANVSEKRINSIIRLEKEYIDKMELDNDGNVKNPETIEQFIKDNYDEYIVKVTQQGVKIGTPAQNLGGGTMTKEQIRKIADPIKRQQAMAANPEMFGLEF